MAAQFPYEINNPTFAIQRTRCSVYVRGKKKHFPRFCTCALFCCSFLYWCIPPMFSCLWCLQHLCCHITQHFNDLWMLLGDDQLRICWYLNFIQFLNITIFSIAILVLLSCHPIDSWCYCYFCCYSISILFLIFSMSLVTKHAAFHYTSFQFYITGARSHA